MSKDMDVYSASRDALEHQKEEYQIQITFPEFSRMMLRDDFMASRITHRSKWDLLVSTGIIKNATKRVGKLDLHAYNKHAGVKKMCIYTHVSSDDVKYQDEKLEIKVKEASQ